jgi:gamma-glutamyl:cysteine ligase YbdK (ATP-grasp superfamily)
MAARTQRRRIATQAVLVAVAALGACLIWVMFTDAPPDAASLKIIAQAGRSQAVEASEIAQLVRAERMPLGIATNHLHQLDKQVTRNCKQLGPARP